MKIIRKLLFLSFLILLLLSAIAFGYYFSVTKNTVLHPESLLFSEKSILVYDHTGEEIRGMHNSAIKQSTKIDDLPLHVKQAFINTEDRRFYKHDGFDYKRIAKACFNNLKAHSFKEGASTISQQLIKNTHLSQEKTLKRKLQERKLTKILEKNYTKDEILELYLNTIYFGHNCFGVTSASRFYFDKSPSELTLSEGAILAGLVKSPNHYSPFKNPEKCKNRRACVLSLMQKCDSISEEEKQAALTESLPRAHESSASRDYTHFVFEELSEISEKLSFKIGGKVQIYTYFSPALQTEVENAAQAYNESDKSIFVLDNHTLGFKASLSTVGNIKRLPGSLIKPLLVYAPAMDKDILSPATPILDEKVDYNGYSPENYGGKYHGYISARECVEQSLNIPAVKVLESLGVDKACEYMQKIALNIDKNDKSLALALGGMKNGFFLKDITSAYATFANQGEYENGAFISKILINGKNVYTRNRNKSIVYGKDTAYLINDVLQGVAKRGTAKKLRSLPYQIAAKTGTVGTENGNTDAYALSYTTKDTVSVWLGNANNEKIPTTGGGIPCNILLDINERIAMLYEKQSIKIEPFIKEQSVQLVKLDKTSYYDRHTLSLADPNAPVEYVISELFKKSQIPLAQNESFTKPNIPVPAVSVDDMGIKIVFPSTCPAYYSYKILRIDCKDNASKIIYEGKKIDCFLDKDFEKGKTYQYAVIPIFNGREGEKILLPNITTPSDEEIAKKDEILKKDWWDY